eukprot:364034-Chlamydomonas_euryale.AAC.15
MAYVRAIGDPSSVSRVFHFEYTTLQVVDMLIFKGREELETYLMLHKNRHHLLYAHGQHRKLAGANSRVAGFNISCPGSKPCCTSRLQPSPGTSGLTAQSIIAPLNLHTDHRVCRAIRAEPDGVEEADRELWLPGLILHDRLPADYAQGLRRMKRSDDRMWMRLSLLQSRCPSQLEPQRCASHEAHYLQTVLVNSARRP